jgi:DNA-directed RNA polymerase specialized sigma24 family protein
MESDGITATPEQLERLRQADWEDIYPKALFWAKKWHAAYLSRTASPWKPEDLLQEAIQGLFSGRRALPKNVSVLTAIINIMRSIASNEGEKVRTSPVSYEEVKEGGTLLDDPASLCDDALRGVAGDETAKKIVALLCEDPDLKARDLAATLGLEIKEIYNTLKRIRRRLKQHLDEVP